MTDRTFELRNEIQREVNNFIAQTGNSEIAGEVILELMEDLYDDEADLQILRYLCEGCVFKAKPVIVGGP